MNILYKTTLYIFMFDISFRSFSSLYLNQPSLFLTEYVFYLIFIILLIYSIKSTNYFNISIIISINITEFIFEIFSTISPDVNNYWYAYSSISLNDLHYPVYAIGMISSLLIPVFILRNCSIHIIPFIL